ncbi:MAG TPA: exodeoxyribonuclease VII large subunit [Candidatus Sulfotelmatobacter sp.]|nr:exodeoxyribonuclease VII large subunit [Candidatus Sulfotelmatobacter sp.]
MTVSAERESILGVAALTRLIKETLGEAFPAVWVRGEISGFKRAESGHLYFAMKEGKEALLNCVMWRGSAGRLGFEPRDGTEVEAFGAISVYEPRGGYQLVVEEMRPGGLGALLLALEELKRRLTAEGLFDPARKRPLPQYPKRIGLVTSPVGAAVRDMVKVLQARWPAIEIVLAPVRVQGEGAAPEIAAAIERFNQRADVDLLIVGRGGGSLEDLWAFNEEAVVRAIAGSAIPVISAVGHEVDWTLADLAADVRAATPSNAAEIAVRDRAEVSRHVRQLRERLERGVRRAIEVRQQKLAALTGKYGFRRHRDLLGAWEQRLDGLLDRLRAALATELRAARDRLSAAIDRYAFRQWRRAIAERREAVLAERDRMHTAMTTLVFQKRKQLEAGMHRLRALSPKRVLERGYCLVRAADGTLVRVAQGLRVGEDLTIEFARGEADARVTEVRAGGTHGA